MKSNKNIFKFLISDLRIWVNLGYSKEEKFHPQTVSFNISVELISCPKAADTDLLKDTICYDGVIQVLINHCKSKKFNLIEHLAKSAFDEISAYLISYKSMIKSITIELHKLSPPVINLCGGVKWIHHIDFE